MNDVRKVIFGTIIGFFMMLGLWFSIIYISSCGYTFTCHRGDLLVERTPIPTLIPSSHSQADMDMGMAQSGECRVAAQDLVGAWVSAGAPEADPFTFVDVNGQTCAGTFADVQPLFTENSAWQSGSLGCISCHNSDLTERSGGLDMTSVAALQQSGIFDNNDWENSRLNEILGMGFTADGHSAEMSDGNPFVYVGAVTVEEEATPAP